MAAGRFGSLKPNRVTPRADTDAEGDPAAFLDAVLPDPAAGADAWPLEDVLALQRAVRTLAQEQADQAGYDHLADFTEAGVLNLVHQARDAVRSSGTRFPSSPS